jgi:hypothetical protein
LIVAALPKHSATKVSVKFGGKASCTGWRIRTEYEAVDGMRNVKAYATEKTCPSVTVL